MSEEWFDAARCGQLSVIVQQLIEENADVDDENGEGYTALMLAAAQHNIEIVRYLIDNGANVNYQNSRGTTVLIYMMAYKHPDLSVLEYLLDEGADVNLKNAFGGNVLHYAAWNGHYDIVERLIDANADVNSKDIQGRTALINASHGGNLDIVKYLMEKGAEVNTCMYEGTYDGKEKNALLYAAFYQHDDIVEYLIDNDAELDVEDLVEKTTTNIIIKTIVKKWNSGRRYMENFLHNENIPFLNMEDRVEEKELVKKYLVKRYGNILTVLWGKYPGFLVFEAIMDNFCPKWKDVLTLQFAERSLYDLCNKTKIPK